MSRRSIPLALALCVMVVLVPAAPAAAERSNTAVTGWSWHPNASPAFLKNKIKNDNMRIVDLEVRTTSPLTFSAVLVKNTGTYKKGWWWWYGATAADIKEKLKEKNARLIDLENYKVGGKQRYAALMVKRKGSDGAGSIRYYNATPKFVADKLKEHKARLIDIDKKSSGRYDVVMVKNSGADKSGWWYWYQATPSFIAKKLKDKKARLIDMEPDGNGRFTVIMVKSKGEYWWWSHSATGTQVTEMINQYGMRIVDLERYVKNGNVRYAVVLINNVNALTTKVRQIMWPKAGTAAFGFYLKRVDGGQIAALQHNKVFEPASMIKVVHLLTALRRVKDDPTWAVTDVIPWYVHPNAPMNGGVCAYQDDGTPITSNDFRNEMSVVLSGMMKQSDNRHTDATWNLVGGRDKLNETIAWAGLTKSQMNHRIGCTWEAPGVTKDQNKFTLLEAGMIYEQVFRAANPVLGTGIEQQQFYDYMSRGTSRFEEVVHAEAGKLGKSDAAASFISNMRGAYKPGGYLNGPPAHCDDNGCKKLLSRSTGGGYIALPFKQGGEIVHRGYVYGNFVDGLFDCGGYHTDDDPKCDPKFAASDEARDKAFKELLRPQINAALKTW